MSAPPKKARKDTNIGQKEKAKLCLFVKNNLDEMMTTWDDFDGIDKLIENIVFGHYVDFAKEIGVTCIEDKSQALAQFKRWRKGARDKEKTFKQTGASGPGDKKAPKKSDADIILLEIDDILRKKQRKGNPEDMNVSTVVPHS